MLVLNFSPSQNGFVEWIPAIGAFALGGQRILPLVQQIYGAYTAISGNHQSNMDAVNYLKTMFGKIGSRSTTTRTRALH